MVLKVGITTGYPCLSSTKSRVGIRNSCTIKHGQTQTLMDPTMPGTCGSPIARGVMCVRVRIVTSSCWLVVGALVLALTIACGDVSTDRIEPSTPPSVDSTGKPIPTRTPVRTPTPLPSGITGATPIPTGGGQLHPPQLTTVAPQPASPDSQITVTGTGGYIKITGGYIEGWRQFHLYFDEQLIGTIGCMMNACRATARIPEDATPGEHKLPLRAAPQ